MRKVATLVGLTVFALAGSAFAQDSSGRIYSGSRPEAAPAADTAAPAPAADPAAAPVGEPAAVPAPEAAAPLVAPAGGDYVSAPLTLSAGAFKVTLPIVLNLSKDAVLKPVWIPLVLEYGITDQLEVFLSHTGVGTPIAGGAGLGGTGGGVCLGGKDRNCPKFYNNLNLGAMFSLLRNNGVELAAIGALELRSLDPMHLAVDLGVNFKYSASPISIRVTPVIGIGANKRSEGNKEYLSVPVQIAFQAMPQLAFFLDSGISGPTTDFGKLYAVPVGIGGSFAVQPGLNVGAEFLLPAVVRGSFYKDAGIGAADVRTLGVFVSYATK